MILILEEKYERRLGTSGTFATFVVPSSRISLLDCLVCFDVPTELAQLILQGT